MTVPDLTGATAIVTGASRGLGAEAAAVLCAAGARVVGVARDKAELDERRERLGAGFVPVAADATDPDVAERLLAQYRPRVLVLNAGAVPLGRPLQEYDWESFSRHWEADVRHAFHWTRQALTLPLDPGSVVVAVSSGAALKGSPVSGGYAGAKAAVRFLTGYAAEESARSGLGIDFRSILPPMTPGSGVGNAGVRAYAERSGVAEEEFLRRMGPVLTPADIGAAIAALATDPALSPGAYQPTAEGLKRLD
ncbi:SDR family NAD(P)-dependent oxidoreductase [Streptacidiphilus rugosus]|uniref:SDR family NAD(P)-dependent oxidoreductase n=1 Tax=Streptacidiphilus rugosus TaxID=405783 RepID=UPI0005671E5D|nr:SDR family oxidoreductase [Streptacidiphilus rugosus]